MAPHLCWHSGEQTVAVSTENVANINFRQTGYRATIEASSDVDIVSASTLADSMHV